MLVSNVLKADDLHVFNCKDVISTNDEDIVHPKDKKDDDTDDAIPRDVGFPFDEEGTEELIEFEGDEDFNEILESANSGDETDDSDKHNG